MMVSKNFLTYQVVSTLTYISWNAKYYIPQEDGGWTIFVVCDEGNVDDKILTLFLAISLLWKKPQSEGVIVEMPHPDSEEEKVWGANGDNQ